MLINIDETTSGNIHETRLFRINYTLLAWDTNMIRVYIFTDLFFVNMVPEDSAEMNLVEMDRWDEELKIGF